MVFNRLGILINLYFNKVALVSRKGGVCSERIVCSTGKEVKRPAKRVCRDQGERVFNKLNLFIILSPLFNQFLKLQYH